MHVCEMFSITRYSLPARFNRCRAHHQGNIQDYKFTSTPPYSTHLHRKHTVHIYYIKQYNQLLKEI